MKRITFLTGYFGSGKTEMALNLAIQKKVNVLVDLDIINPYFRSREMEETLASHGIRTISSGLERAMHVDLPYVAKEAFLPFFNTSISAVYDLGGSGSGARLLRQFRDYLPNDDVDLLFCLNIYREETDSKEKIIREIDAIEMSGGMRPTGLVNTTNYLRKTTMEDIYAGEDVLRTVSEETGLPIVFTGVVSSLDDSDRPVLGEKIPLTLYFRKKWL